MKPTDLEIDEATRILYTRLYNFWRYKKMFPHEVAEDLAQSGILVALQKVNRWQGRSSLLTFMTTVGRHAGIDELRKEQRQNRIKDAFRQAVEWAGLTPRHQTGIRNENDGSEGPTRSHELAR